MQVARHLLAALRSRAPGTLDAQFDEGWVAFRTHVAAALARRMARHQGCERVLRISFGGVIAQLTQRVPEVSGQHSVDFNIAVRRSAISEFVLSKSELRRVGFYALPHRSGPSDRRLWIHC